MGKLREEATLMWLEAKVSGGKLVDMDRSKKKKLQAKTAKVPVGALGKQG